MKKRPQPRKTRYVAYAAASIDGRISLTEKKLPDWTSPEDWKQFQAGLAKADAVVVGSNTYAAAKARLDRRNTYVLTSKVTNTHKKGSVTFVNPARTNLKGVLAGHTVVAIAGGGAVYRTMLEKGLLDELFLTIEPLVFGRGKELFVGGTKTSRFKLASMRKLNPRGTILLHYKRL